MQKESIALVLLALLLAGGLWYYGIQPIPAVSTYPTLPPVDQVLVEETNASSSVPAGFHTLRDTELNVTFNIPLNWKAQVLPEGDGKLSLISPDFADPLGSMQGAYLHYYFASPPDQFRGKPDEYMALLKQGATWTNTSLDGHAAFISTSDTGYTMLVSQFSDDLFVSVNFVDPGEKYSSVLTEFLKSFHVE